MTDPFHPSPSFPTTRPRRLRHHPLVRDLVRETSLSPADLILPLFVRTGRGIRKEIASMPGNYQLSVDTLVEEASAAVELGMPCETLNESMRKFFSTSALCNAGKSFASKTWAS